MYPITILLDLDSPKVSKHLSMRLNHLPSYLRQVKQCHQETLDANAFHANSRRKNYKNNSTTHLFGRATTTSPCLI